MFALTTKTLLASTAILAMTTLSTSVDAAACPTAPYAKCGSNASGTTCCPDNYYCQPWDAGFFQCMPQPQQCKQQFTNVDFWGNDIKTVYGVQPSECCAQCARTAGCVAYTFVNSNPGQPACYLKSAVGERRTSVGAVSGIVSNGPTPPTPPTPAPTTASPQPPTPAPTTTAPSTCRTPAYGNCGNSGGATCCPSGFYCQPWNPTYYQCITPPAKCSVQLTDADFYGNDIKKVYVSQPSLCCDECAKTPGCKAYTYINSNPGQPVCYLKSAAGTPTRVVGAVAGRLN